MDTPSFNLAAIDLRDTSDVCAVFRAGADACRNAKCRQASLEAIAGPGTLIATGDLHDNPLHLAKLVAIAGLGAGDGTPPHPSDGPAHLTLHEIIHSDRLVNGMDFSYRALARVAAIKAQFPERVHVLLGNHELAQVVGAGIVKDGIRVVEAFNDGVEYVFGEQADEVHAAIAQFVRALPLALRAATPKGDVLCAHSVPSPALMGRFDTGVLQRELTEADYEPRQGAAHLMVWGRGYDAEQLEDLVERWGINLFVLGHEKAEAGVKFIPPCAVVLNSDHEHGVWLPIDLQNPPRADQAVEMVVRFADSIEG